MYMVIKFIYRIALKDSNAKSEVYEKCKDTIFIGL